MSVHEPSDVDLDNITMLAQQHGAVTLNRELVEHLIASWRRTEVIEGQRNGAIERLKGIIEWLIPLSDGEIDGRPAKKMSDLQLALITLIRDERTELERLETEIKTT